MARIEKTVFISYRRADVYTALAVYQDLTSKGYDVFFDYTSISSGDFEQIIVSNIKARAHFLLILTPTALDRCSEPGDWLRREIETAIDEQRNIIPLFFKGFNFSSPSVSEKLTGKLGDLGRFNGLNVHEDYFQAAMDRLSRQFLSVPLEAILQPYSTKVRERVKEEQSAAEDALQQKWKEIKEILKPAKEKAGTAEQDQIEKTQNTLFSLERGKSSNLRRYGISTGILAVTLLGIFGVSSLIQNFEREIPIPTFTSQLVLTSTKTTSPPTQPPLVPANSETPVPPTSTFTPTPTLGIGSTIVSPKDGMTLLYVPAGEFRMGGEDQEDDAKHVHTVYLDAFWIDQTEVTNAMYAKCVNDGKCDPPSLSRSATRPNYYGDSDFDSYPVIYVSWDDALSYCAWADRRLPTEAEWEKAARSEDQRVYPWQGEQIDCVHANYYDGIKFCIGDTVPVKNYEVGKSPYAIYDMAGNVWEWVADWYKENYYKSLSSLSSNPTGPTSGQFKVARGGSWYNGEFLSRSANRGVYPPISSTNNIGFRCARSE